MDQVRWRYCWALSLAPCSGTVYWEFWKLGKRGSTVKVDCRKGDLASGEKRIWRTGLRCGTTTHTIHFIGDGAFRELMDPRER